MNKLTYEEALKNIKDNYPLIHPTSYKLIKESYDTLEELIEKAKKQEKLLELYKEFFRLSNLPITTSNMYVFNRLLKIKNEIKELENNEN